MSVKGQPAHYAQLYMQEYSKQSAQMSGLSLFRNITGRHQDNRTHPTTESSHYLGKLSGKRDAGLCKVIHDMLHLFNIKWPTVFKAFPSYMGQEVQEELK